VDLNLTRDEVALVPLRDYLAARGLDPTLAGGPVGARYLALREAGSVATPSEAFDRWFGVLLGAAPQGEAEGQGWIAFLLSGAAPELLLGELPPPLAAIIVTRAPRPPRETPLAMPVQQLKRVQGSRGATAADRLVRSRA
jgi:hypothetical protein